MSGHPLGSPECRSFYVGSIIVPQLCAQTNTVTVHAVTRTHTHTHTHRHTHTRTQGRRDRNRQLYFFFWLSSNEGLTPPPPPPHCIAPIFDMTFHWKKTKRKGRLEKKTEIQESSTMELAVSVGSHHTELHGCAVSGFLGILAVAGGKQMSYRIGDKLKVGRGGGRGGGRIGWVYWREIQTNIQIYIHGRSESPEGDLTFLCADAPGAAWWFWKSAPVRVNQGFQIGRLLTAQHSGQVKLNGCRGTPSYTGSSAFPWTTSCCIVISGLQVEATSAAFTLWGAVRKKRKLAPATTLHILNRK